MLKLAIINENSKAYVEWDWKKVREKIISIYNETKDIQKALNKIEQELKDETVRC